MLFIFGLRKGSDVGRLRVMMHLSVASNIVGQVFRKHSCTTSKPNPNGCVHIYSFWFGLGYIFYDFFSVFIIFVSTKQIGG